MVVWIREGGLCRCSESSALDGPPSWVTFTRHPWGPGVLRRTPGHASKLHALYSYKRRRVQGVLGWGVECCLPAREPRMRPSGAPLNPLTAEAEVETRASPTTQLPPEPTP
ncbi:hypothetical protein DPEC_G00368180 [Dallia pectoralis]|nr:hypothetical protein DPEC_G00368180 [Dallia pectoralis]